MHSKRIREKVKGDYNQIADAFSQTRQFAWKDFDLFLPFYKKNSKVLDLGCGNGRFLRFLTKHGYSSYLGLDQSENLLEIAKREHPKLNFRVGDMAELNEISENYDVIFAIASFHHLPPSLHLKTLKLWREHLKDDGYLFMTNWNLLQRRFWHRWLVCFSRPGFGFFGLLIPFNSEVERYYYAFSKRKLNRLLKKAGFKVVKNDYFKNGEAANFLSGKNIISIAKK
jgi:ubiquinone/menaquinone biosynthesis C-methylase UbiE